MIGIVDPGIGHYSDHKLVGYIESIILSFLKRTSPGVVIPRWIRT